MRMTSMMLWNGRSVPRIGLGCWAIGGPNLNEGPSTSYGDVDDTQSRAALRRGYEMGARVFDTAAGYGAGHSERLVGEEIAKYDDAMIVTKFGYRVDEAARTSGPNDVSDAGVRKTIDGSRQRLRRDRIDLMLLHLNGLPIEEARPAFDTLDDLVAKGWIGAYGWSSDFADGIADVIDRPNFVAVENDFNVFTPASELMALLEQKKIVSISRLPLAMGLLTGKYRPDTKMAANDVRAQGYDWLRFFKNGAPSAAYLERLEALKALLQTGGRSLAQGALGWILAKSPQALPVPGFRNAAQVEDNLVALEKGPLSAEVMADIEATLSSFGDLA